MITEINCDLDGVLVNFNKKATEVTGIDLQAAQTDKKLKSAMWAKIGAYVKNGNQFYGAMEPFEDALTLWNYITGTGVPVFVCTATGHIRTAGDEKRQWIEKHLGADAAQRARIVRNGDDKAAFATPTTLLIDDRQKVIDPWVAAGGVAILHTSAEDTIRQLKEMGL